MNKLELLSLIQSHSDGFRPVGNNEYVIRCPFCGDSDNPKHAHCYIHCDPTNSEPLKWKCFKCPGIPNSGYVGPRFLKALGISEKITSDALGYRINTISRLNDELIINTDTVDMSSLQVRYIESRIGKFNIEDYRRFKMISNMESIRPLVPKKVANVLPSNMDSISFLTYDNGMILNREFAPSSEWRKIPIKTQKTFYRIKTDIDIFTDTPIYVSICEGIFDALGIYKNYYEDGFNVFIAALGPDYTSALEHSIAMGLVGDNVIMRIYIDNDRDEKSIVQSLHKYKQLYQSLTIRKNVKSKDFGVSSNMIKMIEMKIR